MADILGAPMATPFEQLGGEAVLRPIVNRFVDRIFDDVMIGFFFRNASRERVKAKEYEFAARHLGANIAYTGKPLGEAHARHPIMGGQFMRRLQILKDTLAEFEVAPHICDHWVDHTMKLMPVITQDASTECNHGSARQRVLMTERKDS